MCKNDVWVFLQSQGQLFKTRRNYVTFFIDGLCSPSATDERHEKIYEDMHAPPHTLCRVSAVILPIC
jgi:hypothetical protein